MSSSVNARVDGNVVGRPAFTLSRPPSDNDQPRLKLKLACLNANQSALVASPLPYITHALLLNIDAFDRFNIFTLSYIPEILDLLTACLPT
jgi:hypothetical protein